MNKKLLNKVMKKLASSNVVISPTVKSSSPSLSMQKKPEMEQIQQKLEQYLLSRYHFRFNVLTEQTECCKKDADTPIYKVISQRTLNSLCLEARARHINCWDKDVSRFVNSEQMPDYHPLLSYMNTLPEWDGMDRVTPLAQRISTKDFWVNSFHRWMLGVTAQWSGRMDRCANAVAPMLVSSEQGRCKSTFCELLMPDSLKDYYTDSFELTGQAGCEQKLAFFGLINLDEYDRLSPQKLPLLKNLMQMKKLDFRKSHRSSYSHLPRMASFIGTSNRKALLTDPSGSRRYFFAEVKEKIDCSPLEHKQLFRPAESRTGRGKALLVLGGGGIRAETAQPGLLCLAYRSGNDSPLFQTAGERGRLQTLLGSILVQYPAETISGSHARHHDKQNGKNHEFPGSGTDAYHNRKYV